MPPDLIALFLLTGALSAVTIAVVMYNGVPRAETRFTLVVTCSCKNALYRGITCKHAMALVLGSIRQPQPAATPTVEASPAHFSDHAKQPNLTLAGTRRPGWSCSA